MNAHLSTTGVGKASRAPVLPDVLEEHLEELAFLAIQRRKLMFSAELPLRRLRAHDERIAAHLDGLAIGASESVEIARARLDHDDPWQVHAAARVWIEQGAPPVAALLERVSPLGEDELAPWRGALRDAARPAVERLFPAGTLPDAPHAVQALVLDAWAWQGMAPDGALKEAAASPGLPMRRAAARALGVTATPGARTGEALEGLLEDPAPDVRRRALWSLALTSPDVAVERARRAAKAGAADAFELRVVGLLGAPADAEVLASCVRARETGPAAILALGDLGEPRFAPTLLELLASEDESVALAAGAAFETLAGDVPPGGRAEPRPASDVGPSPPDGAAAEEHWRNLAPKMKGECRWLRGKPWPWEGPAEDEPMEALWRALLRTPRGGLEWLRREVWDGFFTGLPSLEAVPGE